MFILYLGASNYTVSTSPTHTVFWLFFFFRCWFGTHARRNHTSPMSPSIWKTPWSSRCEEEEEEEEEELGSGPETRRRLWLPVISRPAWRELLPVVRLRRSGMVQDLWFCPAFTKLGRLWDDTFISLHPCRCEKYKCKKEEKNHVAEVPCELLMSF